MEIAGTELRASCSRGDSPLGRIRSTEILTDHALATKGSALMARKSAKYEFDAKRGLRSGFFLLKAIDLPSID